MIQILTLVFWLGLGAAQQTASGSIEGTVLAQGTMEPIEGAQVTLAGTNPVPPAVATNKEGHFTFSNVSPGRYIIGVQRDGYLTPGLAPNPVNTPYVPTAPLLNVAAGERVAGLTYYLIRGGIISGRILDPLGRPSAGATVYALRVGYQEGHPTLLAAKSASSNDRGEYRIFWLEPGDYYIRAEKTLPSGSARAYYPGSDDAATAVKVRVDGGMESPKIDLSIQSVASVKISGTVSTIVASLATPQPQAVSQGPQLYLIPDDHDGIYDGALAVANTGTSAQDRLAGKFEIANVRPGSYTLIAILADRASTPVRYFMGKTAVDVGFQDVTGIVVEVVPGRDLRGQVIYKGAAAPVPGSSVRVQLRPKEPLPAMAAPGSLTAAVMDDGRFTIPNVPDLQYSVSVTPLPKDAYISDLRQGSFSIFDVGTIVIGKRTNDDFEVIVDSPGATLNGKVEASVAVLAAGVTITLVPDERRRENLSLYKRTAASSTGTFSFASVGPGRYLLLAWEDIPAGAEFNAEFMDAFRDAAQEITLTPGETKAVELRLIPRK